MQVLWNTDLGYTGTRLQGFQNNFGEKIVPEISMTVVAPKNYVSQVLH